MGHGIITRRGPSKPDLSIWKKYDCTSSSTYWYETIRVAERCGLPSSVYHTNSTVANSSTGKFSHYGEAYSGWGSSVGELYTDYTDSRVYEYGGWEDGSGWARAYYEAVRKSNTTYSVDVTKYYGYVVSENSQTYPTNGRHTDGYWYVKQQ